MIERARQVPGVISVGVTRDIPFRGSGERYSFGTDRAPITSVETAPQARVMHVSRDFFRTMGIPLLAGRDFAPTDRAGAPVVLIVSRALADQYFGGSAVGHALVFGDSSYAIVGEVGDVRQDAIDARPVPMIYVSSVQNMRSQMNLVAHTAGDPNRLVKALEAAIRSVDPLQTITSTFTIEDVVHDAVARPRLLTILLGLFAALGLVLGALGVYGVLAFLVGQRRQEIGVRLALGAEPRSVVGLVIRRGLVLSGVGIAIGIAGVLLLTRLMSSVLFDTPPRDPASLTAAIVTLLASAVVASWLPARRAARVDPALVLRGD
jgi:predicted permease